jgi:hypothetical protein
MAGYILGSGMIACLVLRYQMGAGLRTILLFYSEKSRVFNYWHSQQYLVELSASRSYSLSNSNHIFDHPEKGVVYLLYPFPLTIQKGGTP